MRFLFICIVFLFPNLVFAQYCPEIVIAPGLHRDLINHDGNERTRQEVTINYEGKIMQVPIFNGWAPSIKVLYYADGSERHIFDYKERRNWTGSTVWARKPKQTNDSVSAAVEPVQKSSSGNVKFESPFTAPENTNTPFTASESDNQSLFMRRPSEVQ